ncbi:MAG: hypothetical protein ACYSRZ_04930 [Planctomycetota bacterium]|jgi:branched-subunit amino acid transport protein AzlD
MNKTQLLVMWVGIAIVVLMGIFPPWVVIDETNPFYVGYSFMFLPPDAGTWLSKHRHFKPKEYVGVIDFTRLLTQWLMVAVIVGGLIITFKDKKPKDEQKQ